ncbi:hypothetical protein GCM10020000_00150 [Streptomyces olivoverticillatus]
MGGVVAAVGVGDGGFVDELLVEGVVLGECGEGEGVFLRGVVLCWGVQGVIQMQGKGSSVLRAGWLGWGELVEGGAEDGAVVAEGVGDGGVSEPGGGVVGLLLEVGVELVGGGEGLDG